MTAHRFIKMHGIGNDFVVMDARTAPIRLDAARVRAIADRRTGVGCDQLIVLDRARDADVFMRIYNADGGEVGACGNAARCVGLMLMEEKESDSALIETVSGPVRTQAAGPDRVTVDMGPARTDWREIPLAEARDTLHLGVAAGPLSDPVGVSMGNPHVVFFVDDADAVPLADVGPVLEHAPLFPERANIGVAQVLDAGHIRLRVWERGAGLTRACGTGACAALVAAHRRGLAGRAAELRLDGGALDIEWRADNHVWMTGAAAVSFRGETDPALTP